MTAAKTVHVAPLLAAMTKALEEATSKQVADVSAELVDDQRGRRIELRASVIISNRRSSSGEE